MKQNRGVTYFITLSIFHWPLHANPDRCLSMTQPTNIPVAFDYSDANTDRYLPVSLVRLGPLSKFRLRIVHDRYLGLIIQASRLLHYLLREYK